MSADRDEPTSDEWDAALKANLESYRKIPYTSPAIKKLFAHLGDQPMELGDPEMPANTRTLFDILGKGSDRSGRPFPVLGMPRGGYKDLHLHADVMLHGVQHVMSMGKLGNYFSNPTGNFNRNFGLSALRREYNGPLFDYENIEYDGYLQKAAEMIGLEMRVPEEPKWPTPVNVGYLFGSEYPVLSHLAMAVGCNHMPRDQTFQKAYSQYKVNEVSRATATLRFEWPVSYYKRAIGNDKGTIHVDKKR